MWMCDEKWIQRSVEQALHLWIKDDESTRFQTTCSHAANDNNSAVHYTKIESIVANHSVRSVFGGLLGNLSNSSNVFFQSDLDKIPTFEFFRNPYTSSIDDIQSASWRYRKKMIEKETYKVLFGLFFLFSVYICVGVGITRNCAIFSKKKHFRHL